MKYSRKDIQELLTEVGGNRDVFGYPTTSYFAGSTFTLSASGACPIWQDDANPSRRLCEDVSACTSTEDTSCNGTTTPTGPAC